MNNRDLYKDAMSGVHHSEDVIERIFEMTVDKKKTKNSLLFKKIASAALAFVILVVGGGFGTNAIIQKSKQPLTVMVAYANDNGKLSFGSKNDQKLFYGIYVAPSDDKKASDDAFKRWKADAKEIMNELDNNAEDSAGSYGQGGFPCYSSEQNIETAYFYTLEGGNFELNLEDYSDVKSFKVNNESVYGLLMLDYEYEHEVYYEDSDMPAEELSRSITNHEFNLTGDELRYSQDTKTYMVGVREYEQNKGYFLTWNPSEELCHAIGDNPSFDLTQIKDTITFTVEFNDGTVKTASLDLYFDSDGYMHFE